MNKSKANTTVRVPKCSRCGSEDISFLFENVMPKRSYMFFLIFSLIFSLATIVFSYRLASHFDFEFLCTDILCLLLSCLFFFIFKRNYSKYIENITYAVCNVCGYKAFWEYPARDKRKRKAKAHTLIFITVTIIIAIVVSFI